MRNYIVSLCAVLLIGCASDRDYSEPFCTDPYVTAAGYRHDPSVRSTPGTPPHSEHVPPGAALDEPRAPVAGDVIFSKQNRYPVRNEMLNMPARDLGAAWQIGSDQHVLTRNAPNAERNRWNYNPLGVNEYYRDPECYHPSIGLAPSLKDRCTPFTERAEASNAPAPNAKLGPAVPVPNGPKARPRTAGSDWYCGEDQTPEKDGCRYPK